LAAECLQHWPCIHWTGVTMPNLSKHLVILWTIVLGLAMALGSVIAIASCPNVGFTVVETRATAETRAIKISKNRTIFVRRKALTTTSDISEIRLARNHDPSDDDGTVEIKFLPEADQRLHDATTNHSGMRIAFLFNDEVLVNVAWRGPYGMDLGESQVDIKHGLNKARELMKAIRGCTAANASAR
jgi:hypothetical protein